MGEMTGRERIGNILKRKPVDRIGLFEHFGATPKENGLPEAMSMKMMILEISLTLIWICAGLLIWWQIWILYRKF